MLRRALSWNCRDGSRFLTGCDFNGVILSIFYVCFSLSHLENERFALEGPVVSRSTLILCDVETEQIRLENVTEVEVSSGKSSDLVLHGVFHAILCTMILCFLMALEHLKCVCVHACMYHICI